MKTWIAGALAAVVTAALLAPTVSEARRLGGGKSAGMQRSMPTQQSPQTPPAQPAAPQPTAPTPSPATAPAAAATTTAAAAAAAPAKRSWLGPIAGLAAGLGLAALLSHLGLGEEFASVLMLALLAVLAIVVVRFVLARMRGATAADRLAPAGAGAGGGAWDASLRRAEPSLAPQPPLPAAAPSGSDVSVTGAPLAPVAATAPVAAAAGAAGAVSLPAGFDLPAFERVAKMIFIRLQTANDAADLDDLRQFTTPEMFAAARLDIQERAGKPQHTDVERVDAEVVDFAREGDHQVVSVRFHGLVREEKDAAPEAFDEIWHLVKPADDSRPWAIAGIQQRH